MSLYFNRTTQKDGIIQKIERMLGFADGYISGNTSELNKFTSEVNLALDDVLHIIFQVDGTWQFDDSNHSDFPTIFTNLVSGQRDYTFVQDESGNLVLDIYKVFVARNDNSGTYYDELTQVDPETSEKYLNTGFTDGQNVTGTPYKYNMKANGIFLDPIPDYNKTNGIKVFINREASYFTTSDTTKKAGFDGLYHEYLAIKPAYNYARDNGMARAEQLKRDLLEMEERIREHYSRKSRDVRRTLTAKPVMAQ